MGTMGDAADPTMQDRPDGSDGTPPNPAGRWGVVLVILAAVVLVVGTVGPPLFGKGVFLTADTIFYSHPWRAHASPDALDVAHHGPTTDTVDAIYPTRVRFAEAARDGDFLGWDPLVVGGMAVGSESTSGVLNPFAWLYVALPAWYAPAALKAAQMVAALGFTYLFCRRVGTSRLPAIFAGIAFAGSGFLVMWTNWQQSEIAALVPALFWATERHLQRPRAATTVPIALALGAMLLGGFPAVVGYALYVLVGYVAIRVLAERHRPPRTRVAAAGGAGFGLVAGVLLAAAVVVPFAAHLGDLELGDRQETPGDNLGTSTLVTAVAPDALGLSTGGPARSWYGTRNQVEGISFVGATTALAAVAALCLRAPRATPRGVRAALALATVGLGWATFAGGLPLRALQTLPVFGDNYIGRTRSLLGFTVAVLAALGLQALLERRPVGDRRERVGAALVGAATVALAALVLVDALDLARSAERTDVLRSGLLVAAVVLVVAAALLVAIRFGPRRASLVGVAGLTVLLVAESLRLSLPLLPNEDRAQLYPATPGIEFLAAHEGDDRVAPEGFTLFGNAAALLGIRSVTGHVFNAETWKQAVLAADPQAFDRSATYAALQGDEAVIRSPVLDRLGVRWFAASAAHVPPGRREDHGLAAAGCDRPVPLSGPVRARVPAGDGARAVVVRTCAAAPVPAGAVLTTELHTDDTSAVGRQRFAGAAVPAQELVLAVPAEDVRGRGEATVTLTLEGAGGQALPLATTTDGDLALAVVRPADDGLRLAFADDLRVYERTRALPRIRWAGSAVVVEDAAQRLAALAGGTVDHDTVVLSAPDSSAATDPGGGAAARAGLRVVADAPTAVRVAVDADRPGHLVVADALQHGWAATVDGESAELVDADHAGVAVAVPAGRHVVELRHRPEGRRAGLALSVLGAVSLAGAGGWERLRARWRRRHAA